ncbi:uncharacterized protein [Phaseolus vulgaris]|uniref:uncharacterized protein n=1 Tax=Phaseolus vulgaris TaxID=3885 RepID=UPI0035C9643E
MGDLFFCWDLINKMIILQHNAIKASFQKSLNVVGHRFKVTAYKKLLGFVSKYALNLISEELDRVKLVGFDKNRCGCTLTCTHGLPCACQLASFGVGSISLKSIHVMWTRLSFEDITSEQCSSELSIDKEFEVIAKRFKELDVVGKVNIKTKLQEIAFSEKTSINAPHAKNVFLDPLGHNSKVDPNPPFGGLACGLVLGPLPSHLPQILPPKSIPFFDQFPVGYHPYILAVVDVKADGHCGYRVVAAELGMGEESWAVVRMNLLKELSEWRQKYVELFGGDEL